MNDAKRIGAGLLAAVLWVGLAFTNAWAAPSQETQTLVAEHRQAAAEAQKKAVFHDEMAAKFQTGRGGAKIDMVGHCRYWPNHYRKLASEEEKAAKELE